MFEERTYEAILAEMLGRLPASLDKREGSVLWTAIAPIAAEMAQLYVELGDVYNNVFGDTAEREYLIRIAEETRGLRPKNATNAVWRVEVSPSDVSLLGARFTCGAVAFVISARDEVGWIMTCEEAGRAGNTVDELVPVSFITRLESIRAVSLIAPGEEEEETEDFRERWKKSFSALRYGGNKADYIAAAKEVQGVGGVKCYRAQNEEGETVGGHVRIVLAGADCAPATSETVEAVQNLLDPTGDGEGDGLAPIGHIVHVAAVLPCEINVTAALEFEDGTTFEDVKSAIEDKVRAYILGIAKDWAESDGATVRVSQIEAAMLTVEGVKDVFGVKLNGTAENLKVDGEHLAVFGSVEEDNV